jgi:hypothetical protein
MIAEKITGAVAALGDLAGKVTPDVWETLSGVQRVLRGAADQTEAMEEHITMDMLNDFVAKHEAEKAGEIAHG